MSKKETPVTKKDLKESLSGGRKADLTHMRTPFLVLGSRACEYGDAKYERANYLRPMDTIQEDYERYRQYLGAALRHIFIVLDKMEVHQSTDYDLQDIEGMKKACYAEDTDFKEGQAIGASGLPHICGAIASLNLAATQVTRAGLLPADPGRPWENVKPVEEPEEDVKPVAEWEPPPCPYEGCLDAVQIDFEGYWYEACGPHRAMSYEPQSLVVEESYVTMKKDERGVPKVIIHSVGTGPQVNPDQKEPEET